MMKKPEQTIEKLIDKQSVFYCFYLCRWTAIKGRYYSNFHSENFAV